ncbi:beta-ketoacyl synthase chain length factor [Parachitinimonas caeni]|uniref:beta-ketoacyl synthase chain length factor n=1 Tax=Parachitinimonas caeni TaxID=3031301 RepID=UPI0027E4C14B|nr:beta-ketoacyl synthase chain length factor [Parachitinimonas caeni]
MTLRFAISNWAAWAPGLTDQAAWQHWLRHPSQPEAEAGQPTLSEMPAMMRRRVERLGRIALQASYWGLAEQPSCPVVFASRFGDISRSVDLLQQLAQGETLSPTAFSMSVHNAIGALFSIARADPTSYTAIAAGEETVEAAFTEAIGQLADGAEAVLVVYYDEPLPAPHQHFLPNLPDNFPRAWACRLEHAASGGISLECAPHTDATPPASRTADIEILHFLLSESTAHLHIAGKRQWRWQKHA